MGPAPLEELIASFAKLPGIGRKTAQRLAFHVLKGTRAEAESLSRAIVAAKDKIHPCSVCFNFTEQEMEWCEVCRDARRDRQLICAVEQASDVLVLERSQLMKGLYHVLGGVLSPLDGIRPEDLRIQELAARVKEGQVREVILALNASAEGEATAEYIWQQLSPITRVTRLARGLPVGADLDLADEVTLAHALQGRRAF